MRIELMPGFDNVVRFPVERRARATLELLWDIAPDVREVLYIAESFGLDAPEDDLYDKTDLAFAERIRTAVPAAPESLRQATLSDMRKRLIVAAVEACRTSHDASLAASEARERVLAMETGESWRSDVGYYRDGADRLTCESAECLIRAHELTQKASGGSRAIDLARSGQPWTPRSAQSDADWLAAG